MNGIEASGEERSAPVSGGLVWASRIHVLRLGTKALIYFAVPFVFINWTLASQGMAKLLAGLIVFCIGMLKLLEHTRNPRLCGHLATGCFCAYLLAANVLAGGFHQPGIAWLLLCPIAGALLVDIRAGWIWTGVVALALFDLWLVDEIGWMPASEIPPEFRSGYALASMLGATVAVGLIASSFTRIQRQLEDTLREANDQIAHMAFYDSLTGLPNRQLFRDRLDQALARRGRDEKTLGLLFIDLNEFKSVNDTLGHAAGDELLMEISARFRGALRLSDSIGFEEESRSGEHVSRLGGDEFTVLLSEVDGPKGASIVARRLLSSVSDPVMVDGQPITVSASIGIALAEGESPDPDSLLRDADAAMYRAKARGPNEIEFAAAASG